MSPNLNWKNISPSCSFTIVREFGIRMDDQEHYIVGGLGLDDRPTVCYKFILKIVIPEAKGGSSGE
jgi:hypothetical protein